MNAPDAGTQSAAHRVAQLAAGDVLTQDDRDAIVRLVGELDARWSETAAPAADLPATLSSVDDVAKVCSAAGFLERWRSEPDGWTRYYTTPEPDGSEVRVESGANYFLSISIRAAEGGTWQWWGVGPFASMVWHAIQAARSAS